MYTIWNSLWELKDVGITIDSFHKQDDPGIEVREGGFWEIDVIFSPSFNFKQLYAYDLGGTKVDHL